MSNWQDPELKGEDEDKITTLKNNLTPDREDTVASVVVFTADDAKPGFSSNYGGGGITIADQAEEEADQVNNELEMAQEAGVATTYFFSNKSHSKLANTPWITT